MILIDANEPYELLSLIARQGLPCQKQPLDSADVAFEGYGPHGMTLIGVERKKIQDALDCIETGRLGGFQLPKMRQMYTFRFIILEGVWRPDIQHGFLQQEIVKPDGKVWWSDQRRGGKREMYAKLRRFTFSLMMAGAYVIPTRDIMHTAYDVCELYHWFQKPWDKHTSMNTLYTGQAWDRTPMHSEDLMMIPTIDRRPSLVRRWAASLDGIGVKLSADAERVFRNPRDLALADEADWMNVVGVGLRTAADIVRQITGGKK